MMTNFMRDHVGLGEFAVFAAAAAEGMSRKNEVSRYGIRRSVRTSTGPMAACAMPPSATPKCAEPRHSILLAVLLKLPGILCVAERTAATRNHPSGLPLARRLPRLRLVRLLERPAAVHDLGPADQNARIDAERPADRPRMMTVRSQCRRRNRDAHTAAATFLTARVLDIVAAAKIVSMTGSSEDLSQ